MMPSARRFSEENAIRFSIACRGEVMPDGAPVDLELPGLGAVGAVEQADELGAAGAEQPGDADDLAVVDVDVGRLEHAAAADPGRPQNGCARCGRSTRSATEESAASSSSSRPIIFVTSVAAGQVVHAVLADELAVAQHRDAVGDLVDLIEEVADEEDGDAAVAQVADDREQLLDLAAVQARGRLVEDQHLRVEHHGAADGDELLDRDRVAGEHRVGVDREAEARAGGVAASRCVAFQSMPPPRRRLVAEHDVLADREVRAEVDLLVDGRDARRSGRRRSLLKMRGSPLDRDRPGVDRVDAGEGLDERRLAGAVLAHERVHLARPEGEVDGVEGEDAGEADGDPGHLDDRRDGGVRGHDSAAFPSFIVGTSAGGPQRPPGDVLLTYLGTGSVAMRVGSDRISTGGCR